jgi:type IV secretion system protein VirB1
MLPAALLACSLGLVAPSTLEAVIAEESGGNPVAVRVNRNGSVDRGLMQINSSWLPKLGLTAEQIMDPCTNIRVGSTILVSNYTAAVRTFGEGQRALQAALSAYNTGSFVAGTAYVARFYGAGAEIRTNISAAWAPPATATSPQPHRPPDQYRADMTVYFPAEWDGNGN